MRPKGPVKRMNVVMVPCSDSKRSSSGISVKRLRRRWKTDLCMSGKVFSLYTVGKTCQYAAEWDGSIGGEQVIHVPKLIKSGIRAPHMVNSG